MNDLLLVILSIIGLMAFYWVLAGQWRYNRMMRGEMIRGEDHKRVLICPRCGSIDIKMNPDHLSAVIGVTPIESKCKNCGYLSKIFPDICIDDIEMFRKHIKKGKKDKGRAKR